MHPRSFLNAAIWSKSGVWAVTIGRVVHRSKAAKAPFKNPSCQASFMAADSFHALILDNDHFSSLLDSFARPTLEELQLK